MFENIFKRNDPAQDSVSGGAPAPESAHTTSGPSATELQAWRDRIAAANSDDALLLQLAHQAPVVELKLAALQVLNHEESLKQAMQEFRDQDKRLYRAARSRWQAASGRRLAISSARDLIAGARALLDRESVSANRIVEFDREWTALNSEYLDAPLQTEFAVLREQLGTKVRARGEGEQAIARWLVAADSAIEKLSASLAGVAQGDAPPSGSSALAAELLELLGGVPDATEARCMEKCDAATRMLAQASSVVQRAEFLQSLPVSGAGDEADEKLKIEQWRGFPEVAAADLQSQLARRFADWRNAGGDERQRERDARRVHEHERDAAQKNLRWGAIQQDVVAAEAAHTSGNVTELTRLMAVIDRALKPGPVPAGLAKRIDALRQEQKRLRDWQRWSGRQGREQLVAEAQALAATAGAKIAIKLHAEAIEKLRERWKELDKLGGATNQALWLAFDGALKTAYAPVATHLEKLKAARSENLAARNQIVDDLVQAAAKFLPVAQEGGAPAAGSAPDWRTIAHTVDDAQTAWRKLGPVEHTVPRKAQHGDNAVTTRYVRAVQALEAPLKAAYREAAGQREQLIAAAMNLGGSESTTGDVLDKVRALQSQWQVHAKSLALPRNDERRVWSAFKSATDAIFAARDAARAAKESEFSAKIKAREEIIERLEASTAAGSVPEIKRAMGEAEAAWRAAADVPRPQSAKLDTRYRGARDAATRKLGTLAVHAAQARYDALIAKMELCHYREVAADAGGEAAVDLEARWNAVENLPDAWNAGIEARFQGGDAAQSASRSGESLPKILLNLEVACGIDSPADFLAARQQLKLRALKSAMEGRQAIVTTPADIERWLLAAAATPRPDEVSRERMAKIIATVRILRQR